MAGATHTTPVLPPAPKRTERASFKKDMASIASGAKKLVSKRDQIHDEKVEKITINMSEKAKPR